MLRRDEAERAPPPEEGELRLSLSLALWRELLSLSLALWRELPLPLSLLALWRELPLPLPLPLFR